GDVERAGTHAAFVAAAIDNGGKLDAGIATPNVEGANTLGAVDLVGGNGEKVDIVLLHVHRDLAHGLNAIDGKNNAVFFGDLADFRDRIDRANFVVGVHDGDQNRLRRNRFTHFLGIDPAIL